MPRSHVRLSAGRASFSDELQALCFLAGANSIFYGEKLLTTGNPDTEADQRLFARLGSRPSRGPAELGARASALRAARARPAMSVSLDSALPEAARDPPLVRSGDAASTTRASFTTRRGRGCSSASISSISSRASPSTSAARPAAALLALAAPLPRGPRARGRLERRHAARAASAAPRPRRPSRRSAATQSGCRCATRASSSSSRTSCCPGAGRRRCSPRPRACSRPAACCCSRRSARTRCSEVRAAWGAVDSALHVHAAFDLHDIGDLALAAGLAEPVIDVDRLEVTYSSVASLVRRLALMRGA